MLDYNACCTMSEDARSSRFRRLVADNGSPLPSDFLKSGNQLGNIDANHRAFA